MYPLMSGRRRGKDSLRASRLHQKLNWWPPSRRSAELKKQGKEEQKRLWITWQHRWHPLRKTTGSNGYLLLKLTWYWQQRDNSRVPQVLLSLPLKCFAFSRPKLPRFVWKKLAGLPMFWNNEIKLEFLDYSKYHVDMKVSDLEAIHGGCLASMVKPKRINVTRVGIQWRI